MRLRCSRSARSALGRTISFGDGTVVAKDVAREFLRYLKLCAEQALGKTVTRAVVTHPAYFDRGAVEETREAAIEAGFDMSLPEQMLMEPVAAALAYTRTDKRDPLRVLTYDLGGGTFDVTYLERNSGVIDMKAFDGNHLLGGYNFDRELVHWVRKRLEEQGRRIVLDETSAEDRGRLARLLRIAENVKIALAEARTDSTMVDFRARDVLVDTDGLPVQINERISREQFVEMIRPHLKETIECCRRALAKAKADPGELDQVLLVGGSTFGPWVSDSVAAELSRTEPVLFHPEWCVGAGAAIHAKMVLPPVAGDDYKLTLNVPETSAIDQINVGGRVTDAGGAAPGEGFTVTLRLPDAGVMGPAALDQNGEFLFEDVELLENRAEFVHAGGRYGQCRQGAGTSISGDLLPRNIGRLGDDDRLPRPLYVETVDGLVPLAAEGVTLPSRCEATFQRENDNPNISLRLFQEKDRIGEIRIEDIPPEGGRGSYVDLSLEITEKNQIRGLAKVRTRLGQVVAQTNVRVRFEPPDIPMEPELRERFESLKADWAMVCLRDEDQQPDEGECERAAESIVTVERLLEQQPLERQEVFVALRRLNDLINPPEDDMNPTRRRFCEVIAECREALDGMAQKADDILAEASGNGSTDQGLITGAQRNLRKAEHYRPAIDALEQQGLAAHERKDRRSWSRIFDAVTDILVQVRERPDIGELPTFLHKVLSSFEVMRLMNELDEREERLSGEGRLGDWQGEVSRLRAVLTNALAQIDKIDGDMASEQGRARVRLVLSRSVDPFRKDLDQLGVGDVRKLGRK